MLSRFLSTYVKVPCEGQWNASYELSQRSILIWLECCYSWGNYTEGRGEKNSRKRKLVRLVLRSRVVKIVWEGNLVFQQRLKRFSHCICNARLAMFYVTTCTLVYKYTGMTLGGRKDGLVTVPWKWSSELSQSIMLWICFYHLIIIKGILIVWKLGKKKVCGMFFQCYTEPLFNRHTQGSFILEEYTCL